MERTGVLCFEKLTWTIRKVEFSRYDESSGYYVSDGFGRGIVVIRKTRRGTVLEDTHYMRPENTLQWRLGGGV